MVGFEVGDDVGSFVGLLVGSAVVGTANVEDQKGQLSGGFHKLILLFHQTNVVDLHEVKLIVFHAKGDVFTSVFTSSIQAFAISSNCRVIYSLEVLEGFYFTCLFDSALTEYIHTIKKQNLRFTLPYHTLGDYYFCRYSRYTSFV